MDREPIELPDSLPGARFFIAWHNLCIRWLDFCLRPQFLVPYLAAWFVLVAVLAFR